MMERVVTIRNDKMEGKEMTKALVAGCACVVFSVLTPEEIDRFKQYQPEALKLIDENNPEDVFTLDIDDGPGHVEETEAVYSRTKSADGKATITILLDPDEENKLGLAQKKIGRMLVKLQKLEEKLLESTEVVAELERNANTLISLA